MYDSRWTKSPLGKIHTHYEKVFSLVDSFATAYYRYALGTANDDELVAARLEPDTRYGGHL